MFRNTRSFAVAIFAAASSYHPAAVIAQTQPSGPLFSTPASRSTTGAPILSDPSSDSNGIIGSAGGGAAATAPPRQVAPQQSPAEAPTDRQRRYDDWEVQCEQASGSANRCQISGRTLSPDGGQVILVMSLAKDANADRMLYQAALPLGIAVQKSVSVSVDDAFKTELIVSRCTPQGCLLEGTAESKFIDALKSGSKASFSVSTAEGQVIPIALSLNGFSEGLAALPSN